MCKVVGIGTCADTELVIPSEYRGLPVTAIDRQAFKGQTQLTSVVIPEGVTSIGAMSFQMNKELTTITISDKVTLINQAAFFKCEKLETIIFTGTMEQWKAIDKKNIWDRGTGDYTVRCTDGVLDKSGNLIEE